MSNQDEHEAIFPAGTTIMESMFGQDLSVAQITVGGAGPVSVPQTGRLVFTVISQPGPAAFSHHIP